MDEPTASPGSEEPDDHPQVAPPPPLGDGDGAGLPLTPGAARRRLANELRALRERADRTLQEAGDAIERSAATISRFESARTLPREVDVLALLDYYENVSNIVTNEVRSRVLYLRGEGKKEQWYSAFKDAFTGEMIPAHMIKFVEYETDAEWIRTYESDRIPGLLQTYEYALAVAQIFFPSHSAKEHARFAEFRQARQARLRGRGNPRLSFIVNEVALRREVGPPQVLREQLVSLLDIARGGAPDGVDLRVVPATKATPAAMDGPFVLMSFPEDSEDRELVYLETRSGANYLAAEADVERFNLYFEDLKTVSLSAEETVRLIESIVLGLSG